MFFEPAVIIVITRINAPFQTDNLVSVYMSYFA